MGKILMRTPLYDSITSMENRYTAVTKQEGDWWIGWVEEIPGVNCQERSHKELIASLKTTLSEALAFNREDARKAAESNYTEELLMA